jgi:hypothetical protein
MLLAYSVCAATALLISMFGLAWFHMDLRISASLAGMNPAIAQLGAAPRLDVGLHTVTLCNPMCVSTGMSNLTGTYPTLANVTFWASLVLLGILAHQTGRKIVTDQAPESATHLGWLVAMICFVCAGLTGYVFAPESGASEMASVVVHRTWAPGLAMLGYALAFPALRLAVAEARLPEPASASQQVAPIVAAPQPVVRDAYVPAVRQRLPDSIPLEPEYTVPVAGIAAAHDPFAPPHDAFAPPPDAFAPPPDAFAPPPYGLEPLHPSLRYASKRLGIGEAGLDAEQEDGGSRRVAWADIVGAVARRTPAAAPYAGETFVDVISTAGATLRLTPWTTTSGEFLAGEGAERARGFLRLLGVRCPAAKLDAATRAFVAGHESALQLPDADVLAQHDARVG